MITRKAQQGHSIREAMRGGEKYVQFTDLSARVPDNVRVYSILTLIPGASIGYHTHRGEMELVYFMEGTCRVQDDDKTYYATAGDSMIVASGHSHGMENTGDGDAVLVSIIIKD